MLAPHTFGDNDTCGASNRNRKIRPQSSVTLAQHPSEVLGRESPWLVHRGGLGRVWFRGLCRVTAIFDVFSMTVNVLLALCRRISVPNAVCREYFRGANTAVLILQIYLRWSIHYIRISPVR